MAEQNATREREKALEFDVRRSVLLGEYIKLWGVPDRRTVFRRGDDLIEVYGFPTERVTRVATVGVSDRQCGYECLMVLPVDFAGADFAQCAGFVVDVATHLRETSPTRVAPGETLPPTDLAPRGWMARALLVDDPRGESEVLESIHVGAQHVSVLWVVPIHADERELIIGSGILAFDAAVAASEWSVVDPRRASAVLTPDLPSRASSGESNC